MNAEVCDKKLSVHSSFWVAVLSLVRLSISWCHALGQLTCCQSTGEAEL